MKRTFFSRSLLSLAVSLVFICGFYAQVSALGSQQNPQSSSAGLEGRIPSPPPSLGATIALPVSGTTFNSTPITVRGVCPTGLLIKVFSNNIFVGSAECVNGSFSIQVDLLSGRNDLIARDYDALDQSGPDSNTVSVTFQGAEFSEQASRPSLTSQYAKLGADPGAQLSWPLILSGGVGPYAVSVDWGDGSGVNPQSVSFTGTFNATHVYKNAGIYAVIVKASDSNGSSAFLQLVGVANGKVTQGGASGASSGTQTVIKEEIVWWPFAILLPLIAIGFWLGKRYELLSLHRQLERQSSEYDRF